MYLGLNLGLNTYCGGVIYPFSPSSLLLERLSATSSAAYSLRKLSSDYAGAAIRVRRSSDNQETDIGFINNELDAATLLSFVGANDGFVTTWYDQSGNNKNIIQATTALQPIIVSSGALQTLNGKPAINFTTNKGLIAAYNTNLFLSFTVMVSPITPWGFIS